MDDIDRRISAIAARQRNLVSRGQVVECGGTDEHIRTRLARRRWRRIHAGVYLIGAAPPDWHQRQLAAVLAASHRGAVGTSHRAAVVLWGLDGIGSAPIELTVETRGRPRVPGVIVHRTGRPLELVDHNGIPVTTVKRTLLDAAGCLPPLVLVKAFESAYRKGLVTPDGMLDYLDQQHGRGVEGIGEIRSYLARRTAGPAAGSAAEVEVLELLHQWGIEPPERQYVIRLGRGRVVTVDLAWPHRRKAAEIQGFDGHSSPADVEADADRANAIQDAGWELRCYGARTAQRDPAALARRIRRFLEAPATLSIGRDREHARTCRERSGQVPSPSGS